MHAYSFKEEAPLITYKKPTENQAPTMRNQQGFLTDEDACLSPGAFQATRSLSHYEHE